MEKNTDFSAPNPHMGFDGSGHMDPNFSSYDPNLFNPISQYEQAYMYYRYLTQQLEYKIKCKEYERLCGRDRKIEQYLVWLKNFSPMI